MKNLIVFTLLAAVMATGCVKVQLLPEDAVKNTWKAGKNLYDEKKLKRDGGTKREHSSQIVVSEYPSREEAEKVCMSSLKARLDDESVSRDAIIVSERVIVVDGLEDNVIECQVVGFVWLEEA